MVANLWLPWQHEMSYNHKILRKVTKFVENDHDQEKFGLDE